MISAEELRKLSLYDPRTGTFLRTKNGKPAGSVFKDGYVYITFGRGRRYKAHHLAWLYMTGEWPSQLIDHINRIRRDNRWENLRLATKSQNAVNSKIRSTSKSGVTGVYKGNGAWVSEIYVQGKYIYLGRFKDMETAKAVRINAEKLYFGDFSPTGGLDERHL